MESKQMGWVCTNDNLLPGVQLSPDFVFYEKLRLAASVSMQSELEGVKADVELAAWMGLHLLNKKRDQENYAMLTKEVSNRLGHGVGESDFETIPRTITKDTLAHLLRGNPFMASAINSETMADGTQQLCLSSHPTKCNECPNFFQKFTSCMDNKWDRFHAILSNELGIESVTIFRASPSGEWETVELDGREQINVITSTLMFYFQCVHANLHILHFIMVAGLYTVTRDNSKLEAFAAPYLPNIILKYEEVRTLLISKSGALVKGFCEGNRPRLLGVFTELLSFWGKCGGSKQFVDTFLFPAKSRRLARNDVWVPQFRMQADLVPDFAADVASHMSADADYALPKCNAALSKFFKECGPDVFAIQGIDQWLEIMSVTGLLHGCTLSLTRVTFTEANLWQMSPESDEFTPNIIEQMGTAFGTLVGLDEDRQVFTDEGLEVDVELKKVVHKHLEKSEQLKQSYAKLQDQNGEEFKTWGWIMTDYFPDLFDAKQLTITTYV
jgi:hypothetical protein